MVSEESQISRSVRETTGARFTGRLSAKRQIALRKPPLYQKKAVPRTANEGNGGMEELCQRELTSIRY